MDRPEPVFTIASVIPLSEVKRAYLRWILSLVRGNKAEAARLLQIDRSSLYRLLRDSSLTKSTARRSKIPDRRSKSREG